MTEVGGTKWLPKMAHVAVSNMYIPHARSLVPKIKFDVACQKARLWQVVIWSCHMRVILQAPEAPGAVVNPTARRVANGQTSCQRSRTWLRDMCQTPRTWQIVI